MNIYFSGIGGVGIGPLAMLALDGGYHVEGSDLQQSAMFDAVAKHGATTHIGQDGSQITSAHKNSPIDWFVYSSALPSDHPELVFAQQHGIKTSKRDGFLNDFLRQKNLHLVAVAGTHGKTTTTAMVAWLFKELGIPVSYSIGTNIGFGNAAEYAADSHYFIYECDEFDRNFLHFSPAFSLITSIGYDHPDTYKTEQDYIEAFRQFTSQSTKTIAWQNDIDFLGLPMGQTILAVDEESDNISRLRLAGDHTRRNAWLAVKTVHELFPEKDLQEIINAIERFPGTNRRFEKLQEGIYSDYAHHPAEIAATLQMATEVNPNVIAVYQPHQNIRQQHIQDEYKDSFAMAKHVYWLPTYLSREDKSLAILSPEELIAKLDTPAIAEPAELNGALVDKINAAHKDGILVLFMGAGDIDGWARKNFKQ